MLDKPRDLKGMFLDDAEIWRCSKCGWPRDQMVAGLHWPCVTSAELAAKLGEVVDAKP